MDPVTMMMIAKGAEIGFNYLADSQARASNEAQNEEMLANLERTAGLLKGKYEEMFDIADMFKPGGKAWQDAKQGAIDTAFFTAEKGKEDLMSKGIDLTSYGGDMSSDIIHDKFTTGLMEDYKDLTGLGTQWAQIGSGIMGDYASMLTTGYNQDYRHYLSQEVEEGSGWSALGDIANMFTNPATYGIKPPSSTTTTTTTTG